MTLNFTYAIVSGGSPLLQKTFNKQHLHPGFVDNFRVSALLEKNSTTIFFLGKTKFFPSPRFYAQVLKKVFRVLYSAWVWPTNFVINQNFMFLETLQVSWSDKTQFPEVTTLRFLFTCCLFLFNHWLGYCTKALQPKNNRNGPVNALKKECQSEFCHFREKL